MIFPIYIASKNRPDASFIKIAQSLVDVDVYVVVEPQDADKYEGNVCVLPDNDRGLMFARNWILANAVSKYFWMIDDDIQSFSQYSDGKTQKISTQEALENAQKEIFQFPNVVMGALEYTQWSWAAKKQYKFNHYCDCVVAINRDALQKYKYDEGFLLKGDRDMVLQIIAGGERTVRLTNLGFSTATYGSNTGGLHDVYHSESAVPKEKLMADRMCRKWGDVCKTVLKTNGRYDAKIDWKRFKVDIG
jgi:hypothetical protein